jgi:hypothetical protein
MFRAVHCMPITHMPTLARLEQIYRSRYKINFCTPLRIITENSPNYGLRSPSPHVSFVTCCHQHEPTKLRRDLLTYSMEQSPS